MTAPEFPWSLGWIQPARTAPKKGAFRQRPLPPGMAFVHLDGLHPRVGEGFRPLWAQRPRGFAEVQETLERMLAASPPGERREERYTPRAQTLI